jgi:hypothetical protein
MAEMTEEQRQILRAAEDRLKKKRSLPVMTTFILSPFSLYQIHPKMTLQNGNFPRLRCGYHRFDKLKERVFEIAIMFLVFLCADDHKPADQH